MTMLSQAIIEQYINEITVWCTGGGVSTFNITANSEMDRDSLQADNTTELLMIYITVEGFKMILCATDPKRVNAL